MSYKSDAKHPEIEIDLSSCDGNAFAILALCTKAMRRGGITNEERDAFLNEAKSGDYDHLVQTVMAWFEAT